MRLARSILHNAFGYYRHTTSIEIDIILSLINYVLQFLLKWIFPITYKLLLRLKQVSRIPKLKSYNYDNCKYTRNKQQSKYLLTQYLNFGMIHIFENLFTNVHVACGFQVSLLSKVCVISLFVL